MKFRIVKDGLMSYKAQFTYNGEVWVTINHFFTKHGAKQCCVLFAKNCNHELNKNDIEEFKL